MAGASEMFLGRAQNGNIGVTKPRGVPEMFEAQFDQKAWLARIGYDLCGPQRDRMALLVGIAAHLRAVLAAHVALQLMDRRALRSPPDVQRDGLIGVAAMDFQIAVPSIELQLAVDGAAGTTERCVDRNPGAPLTLEPSVDA
jgi:hypothetical protein